MSRVPIVRPWQALESYDLFLATVGFEDRARYIAETHRPLTRKAVACAFSERKVYHYQDNMEWYRGAGFDLVEKRDDEFLSWFGTLVDSCRHKGAISYSFAIDISSSSRLRLASIVDVLRNNSLGAPVCVDFLYAIAEFSPPSVEEFPNVYLGPVLESFAGWSLHPEEPSAAIVGLGYEENKALGAVEHLQVSQVWAFAPTSPIVEYRAALEGANKILFESIPPSRRLDYRVEQPFDCFVVLESLVDRCLRSSGVVILPFGPKIFTVCALLVASVHTDASVWRVSAGGAEPPRDRVASGLVCGIRAEF